MGLLRRSRAPGAFTRDVRSKTLQTTSLSMKEREITALEEGLGYHFRRRAMIEQAVTHSSQAREMEAQQAGESKYKISDNEQLEFLGDAVLALVTSEELFQRFPQFREGELSKLRAHLVSE